ncbi:activating signal cointegrator 1 complex subunit 3 [Planococcus citri]|uniref:activating signal cointegrator 1 complex subunit 3 n=1 Tax=Planococcus citri TaxID=170843 RepID=UPI0031F7F7F7
MEEEIADKILNFLRKSPNKNALNNVESNLNISSPSSSYALENGNDSCADDSISPEDPNEFECFAQSSVPFSLDFSFTQYVSQSVDKFHEVKISEYKERNNVILDERRTTSENRSMWTKFCSFMDECLESETEVQTLLNELKTDVSSFTGINEKSELLEIATLTIFNLYVKEKTSTNRKEELQRIFHVSDFKNIYSVTTTVNSILKLFSDRRLEDFNIRWYEVFKDRIEDLESLLGSDSKGKESASNSFTNNRSFNKEESWKNLKKFNVSNTSDKHIIFKEMLFDEKLNDPAVEMAVEKKECFNGSDVPSDELVTLCINIDLKNDGSNNYAGDSCKVNRAFIMCRMPVESVVYELNKNIVQRMLLKKLKKILKNEKLKSRFKDSKKKVVKRVKSSNQQRSMFYYDNDANDIQSKTESNVIGKNWIEKQLRAILSEEVYDSINYKLVVLGILDLIMSTLSNENLESQLTDVFGPKNVNFVKSLLEHRESIQNHCKSSNKKRSVQTLSLMELEKLGELLNQFEEENEYMYEKSPKSDFYNSTEGRKTTKSAKSISSRSKTISYPNVFDSNLEAKLSPGFISGTKIMLPENHRRKDTRVYEEVYIPVSPPALPSNLETERVAISSLDKIGQSAFHGIKSLNTIQSIVFKTAYYSNDNLLICAPTGAGKTNIALLTMVHEIKQNIEHGVLQKDNFKIIYIAPMKALAAEMTQNFSVRLKELGINVRELTGDMQLTKKEIANTQLLVTTPEKWDLVTRKGDGDTTLSSLVKLLIIDEVHLLHSDRGPVIEALVSRTLRQVETSQKMIRIVGLSATLPNYLDVAAFLRVNPQVGLFFFDSRFRPVPLSQRFVGVKSRKPAQQNMEMNQVCYDTLLPVIKDGMQVMVFVHARNATMRTAMALKEMAQTKGHLSLFESKEDKNIQSKKLFDRVKSKQLGELLSYGFAVHHAGLLRHDRSLVEDCFSKGLVKVLVCTATLAWGVNLPANMVIIKGTEIYDAKHGSFVDLGILDVLQIFGRAGRPQFNEFGDGVIITSHSKLHHYLSLMMNQFPIESKFISYLSDNLNAEITLGTINSIDDAIEWLSYTYLFVRMKRNPQEYGINYTDVENDFTLFNKRKELIVHSAKILDKLRMIRYHEEIGKLSPTDLGRTASHFYVKYDTIEIFNELLKPFMNESDTLKMLAQATEFEQLKVRDEEMDELDQLQPQCCEYDVTLGSENIHGKVNILLQTFLSRGHVKSFSLVSDLAYISQNASRIMRALFDIVLRRNDPILAGRFLRVSKMFERQLWFFETPLRQFHTIPFDILDKIEKKEIPVEKFREMDVKEIGELIRNAKMGARLKQCAEEFPLLHLNAIVQPITRGVLRIRLKIRADFTWNDRVHGKSVEPFWVWVEDSENNFIYHSEYFLLSRKHVMKGEVQELVFTIPIHDHERLPSQYMIRVPSDRWLGSVSSTPISLQSIVLPELHPVQTELLPLQPLPVTALQNSDFESLYKFTHFNPIQTQIFHCLYHTDNNVLLGAPTGSGKTIVAEIAFFRVFKDNPDAKVVYIAPLKALVKERMRDWKVRFQKKLKKEVVELTGDVTPDIQAISSASIIVTTPEKWDSISRSWQTRTYVKKVVLIVIDEIHLLGEDRGPVLEVIVSRTNFIVSHTEKNIRIVGLSTALANAQDLANWLRIDEMGMYNFRPSVRPVPLEVHISAFPGKYYCARMASMNKPVFQAIKQYSISQPVLVFVSSRRQTRLTAMDLLAQLASENNPKQWLKIKDHKMNKILETIKDDNLKMVLGFGIGLHHAGLQENDRKIVEELFEHQHIQVLIATSTLAWGVNFPAHLVIVKGTEYYDCKSHRYVDMPITDILQMMGRAGRPQFDKSGIAVVMVHDVKKNFYKKFLYEPFPVESNLLAVLPDHLNAEIVAGTLRTCQDAVDYLTWTYFFRRLLQNPTFYNISSAQQEDVNDFLSNLIKGAVTTLQNSHCVVLDEDDRTLYPTTFGRIASYYYISHNTMLHFANKLKSDMSIEDLLHVLSHASEYNEIPVRHNEEIYNAELAKYCPVKVDPSTYDSPHTKTHLLLQAHFSHLVLPCTDYQTDLKSVLDQSLRILQAMIDVCGERGWLVSTLRAQQLIQMLVQGRWVTNHSLLTLPHIEQRHVYLFTRGYPMPPSLPALRETVCDNYSELMNMLQNEFTESQINSIYEVLCNLPKIQINFTISESIQQNKFDDEPTDAPKIEVVDLHKPVVVHSGREYVLNLRMIQLVNRKDIRVHAPRFPKPKDESWFLTLGCIRTKDLLSMKRFTFGRRTEVFHNLIYKVPDKTGRERLSIYLMSDSYLGLDQQYNITLDIIS